MNNAKTPDRFLIEKILQIKDLFSQETIERVDQEIQRYQMGFLGTMASVVLVSMGIVFFRGRRIWKAILSYQLTPKRKKLHQIVMLSGLMGGMIFLLLLGLIMAILLNGNYIQFGLQPFIPLFPVLAITGGYAMLIEIYHILHRRTLTTVLHVQKSEQVN